MSPSARLDVLASFLPSLVTRRLVRDGGAAPLPIDERVPAAALYADISGFTALTEQLAQRGPAGVEELTDLLNAYFARLVDLIAGHGGVVVKFAGDALLALWLADGDGPLLADATLRAARCGLAVQALMRDVRPPVGDVTLSMRVSVGAGDVTTAHIGGLRERREFYVAGPPLVQVGRASHDARPGDVVLSPEAWALAAGRCEGDVLGAGNALLSAVVTPAAARAEPPFVLDAALEPALLAYIPGAIRMRLDGGQTNWLAELRRITVLFVNLSALDHTRPVSLVQDVTCALQETLYRFEGSLNKLSIDDKGATLVAAFGLPPLAHEDDAARGLQAALAIRERLRSLDLGCAIGVTTGRAFCGIVGGTRRREYTIIGDVVNVAARLMQLPQGGVLCDAATHQAARPRLDFDALPPVIVKGKAEPLPVFRPRGVAALDGPRRRAPFVVARAAERARLVEGMEALVRGDVPRAGYVIEGEAGIGKSCLVEDLLARADERGVQPIVGAGDAVEKATPYYAWRAVCRALVGPGAASGVGTWRDAVRARCDADPQLQPLAPLVGDVLGLDGQGDALTAQMSAEVRAVNTRRALTRLIETTATSAPVLLVIEDAQWLDSASWAALLAVHEASRRLMTVVAARPFADAPPEEYARFLALAGTERFHLGPLSPEDTLALVCRRLGARTLPAPVVAMIRDRAQGNPFFSEELALSLRERGLLRVDEAGECALAPGVTDLASVDLPDTVEGLVTSRIDRLAPAQQLALKAASVIGRTFAARLVREIFPLETERPRTPEHLDTLARVNITSRQLDDPEPVYTFRESITQEVAYNLMSFEQLHHRNAPPRIPLRRRDPCRKPSRLVTA